MRLLGWRNLNGPIEIDLSYFNEFSREDRKPTFSSYETYRSIAQDSLTAQRGSLYSSRQLLIKEPSFLSL